MTILNHLTIREAAYYLYFKGKIMEAWTRISGTITP